MSFLYISPEKHQITSQYHSLQLQKRIIRDGDTERTDYINENGEISTASDLKYATILVTQGENYRLEKFFDDKGEPTRRYSGEWAMLREFNEQGNNIRNTSLNADSKPIINTSGYAIEEREYDQNKQVIAVRYYDTDGLPVNTVV